MSEAVKKLEIFLKSDKDYEDMFWSVVQMLVARYGVKAPDLLYLSKLLQEFGWHGQIKVTPAQDDIDALNIHLVKRASAHFKRIRAFRDSRIEVIKPTVQ